MQLNSCMRVNVTCVSVWVSEWQELIKVCSGSSVLVICPTIPQGTNSMRQDLAVKVARHIMHYEEKFISLFLCPFTSLSCTYAIVNWQTCQWLISPGVRPPHLVLALASPYLASVSSLSLIRGNGGSRSWVKKKNEKKKRGVVKKVTEKGRNRGRKRAWLRRRVSVVTPSPPPPLFCAI